MAAEEWSVPPWQIEEQATQEWWERWAVWRDERARYEKKRDGKPQGLMGDGRPQN